MTPRGLPLICALLSLAIAPPAQPSQLSGAVPKEVALGTRSTIDISAKAVVGPSVVTDDRDRIHLVWVEEHQQGRTIRYTSTEPADQRFRPAVAVHGADEAPYWRQEAPALGVRGEQVYIAWAKAIFPTPSDKPFANELRLSRSVDGGRTFLSSTLINDDGQPLNHSFDSLHVDHDGVIHVAWIDGRDGQNDPATYSSRSGDQGQTFEANRKIDGDTCVCCRTSVVVAHDGGVYVAWRKVLGEFRETVVARSDDGGRTFTPAVVVGNDRWVYPSCPHRPASLGVDDTGRVYVVWYTEGEDETPAVYLAYSDDRGRTFSPKRMLNMSKGTFPDHPQLAVDAQGRLVAVWEELSPVRREVVMSYSLDRGMTFSRPVKLNERKGESPAVSVNQSGQFVLAWKEHVMPAHRLVVLPLSFTSTRARTEQSR